MIGLEGKNALIRGATSGDRDQTCSTTVQIAINYHKKPKAAPDTQQMALQKACKNIELWCELAAGSKRCLPKVRHS